MLHPRKSTIRILIVVLTISCAIGLLAPSAQAVVHLLDTQPTRALTDVSGLLPTPTLESSIAPTAIGQGRAAQPTPTATLVPTQTPSPPRTALKAQVTDRANLRSGPGTDYEIVGSADAGTELIILGSNDAGDWYQIAEGRWIAAFLVSEPGAPVPTLPPTPTPLPTSTPNAAATAAMERRANATATIAARTYTEPDGIWCAQGSARAVCVGAFDYTQSYGYYSAPSGARLVVFVVDVINTGDSDISANPNDITLVTADGRSHSYDSATFEAQQPFEHVMIAPGDEALGAIVFVTDNETAPERVIYRGGFWEDPIVVDLRKNPID